MARKPIHKVLENSRLLKEYASWIYCTGCEKTVAYLCYVTYDAFSFSYVCGCGSKGSVNIQFKDVTSKASEKSLILKKNRLCCPHDDSPLLTVLDKKLESYSFQITCNNCDTTYQMKKNRCGK